MRGRLLPVALILLALVIASCFATSLYVNRWQYVRGGLVRVNRLSGETQHLTRAGWQKLSR